MNQKLFIDVAWVKAACSVIPTRLGYWWCRECDVKWTGIDGTCWNCGKDLTNA